MNHDLKIDSVYLEQKLAGNKLFEIRRNDRGYQKGDTVIYKEYPFKGGVIRHKFEILYVTNFMQSDNYVVFAEKHIDTIKV